MPDDSFAVAEKQNPLKEIIHSPVSEIPLLCEPKTNTKIILKEKKLVTHENQ